MTDKSESAPTGDAAPSSAGAGPWLTFDQVEAYRKENTIALHPEQMEPWAHEENRVLNALCDNYLAAIAMAAPPATQTAGMVMVPRGVLEEIASALDVGLGDSDLTHFETDEEVREGAPLQWACSQLNRLLAASKEKP